MSIAKLTPRERELIDGSNPGLNLAGFGDRVDEIIEAVNAAGTIEASEIAANAVTTAKIADGAVTAAKLASGLGTKVAQVAGVNADALGLEDVGTVLAVLAFTTATGAPATKCLLAETTDYTVADGDITTVGDLSAQTLVIAYLPA